jgi:hypothetical protein
MVHLSRQTPAGKTEDGDHQRDDREDGWDAADPSFKPSDRRSQHEREKDGECDRHEHCLPPVQVLTVRLPLREEAKPNRIRIAVAA